MEEAMGVAKAPRIGPSAHTKDIKKQVLCQQCQQPIPVFTDQLLARKRRWLVVQASMLKQPLVL